MVSFRHQGGFVKEWYFVGEIEMTILTWIIQKKSFDKMENSVASIKEI